MRIASSPHQRVLGYLAVALAYLQIVFGAIVRITGSGMGCGDDWPRCAGEFIPPLDRPDLIIEVTHRYLALALSVVVIALLVSAVARQRAGGADLRKPASLAVVLVVAAALLGAATVKLALSPQLVVAHLTIAMTLLATLVWFTVRTGGFGAVRQSSVSEATARTRRGAIAAAVIAFTVVVLGALTANVPFAAGACVGFPHCREIVAEGAPLWLHLAHRTLAFALLGHLIGFALGVRRRGEAVSVRRAAFAALGLAVVQVIIAAAMVEMSFASVFRFAHQALGTLTLLTVFTLTALTRVGAAPLARAT